MDGDRVRQQQLWVSVELGSETQPLLVCWATYYPPGSARGAVGGTHYVSYAIPAGAGPVLIDPALPDPTLPAPAAAGRLQALLGALGGRPLASVLTTELHERDAYEIRRRDGAPVWGPAAGRPAFEGQPDDYFDDDAVLPGGLRARTIDGPFPDTTCLHWTSPDGTGVLFAGELLRGRAFAQDVRPELAAFVPYVLPRQPALTLCPVGIDPRGVRDTARFKASLRRVLDEAFTLICPAHGQPCRHDARGTLARLLAA
jgi:hypothetical protein